MSRPGRSGGRHSPGGGLTNAIGHFRESVAILDEVDWTAVRSLSLAGLTESLALNGDADGAAAALRDVIRRPGPGQP